VRDLVVRSVKANEKREISPSSRNMDFSFSFEMTRLVEMIKGGRIIWGQSTEVQSPGVSFKRRIIQICPFGHGAIIQFNYWVTYQLKSESTKRRADTRLAESNDRLILIDPGLFQ
jgi:hypothetical protein